MARLAQAEKQLITCAPCPTPSPAPSLRPCVGALSNLCSLAEPPTLPACTAHIPHSKSTTPAHPHLHSAAPSGLGGSSGSGGGGALGLAPQRGGSAPGIHGGAPPCLGAKHARAPPGAAGGRGACGQGLAVQCGPLHACVCMCGAAGMTHWGLGVIKVHQNGGESTGRAGTYPLQWCMYAWSAGEHDMKGEGTGLLSASATPAWSHMIQASQQST